MRKKIIGFALLFVLTAPLVVTFLWLKNKKREIKREVTQQILQKLEADELTVLSFAKADIATVLHWEHSQEFEWKGQMYDVVKTETKGDSVYYLCFKDDKETAVNKKINTLLAGMWQGNPQKKEHQNRVINFYKSLYKNTFTFAVAGTFAQPAQQFYVKSEQLFTRFVRPPAPPPKIEAQYNLL